MQLARLKSTIKGLFLAFGVAGLVSCGSGDDASDSTFSCGGVDESGICLQVDLVAPVHLDANFTSDVDVNGPVDCDPDPMNVDPEPFTEHFADVTFSASFVSGNPVAASFAEITGFTVSFIPNAVNPLVTCPAPTAASAPCAAAPGPGPAIAPLTSLYNLTIPVGTSVTATIPMLNFQRKDDYTPAVDFDIFTGGPYDASVTPAFLSYTVLYVFEAEDEFGNGLQASGSTEISIGAYNNCP